MVAENHIEGLALQVKAAGGAAHSAVVRRRYVGAGDDHRPGQIIPERLQLVHRRRIDQQLALTRRQFARQEVGPAPMGRWVLAEMRNFHCMLQT